MQYRVGDTVPPSSRMPLWTSGEQRWYALTTIPQAELPMRSWLMRNGAAEAWFPTREHRIHRKHGRVKVIVRTVPEWPRYILALMPPPTSWENLFDLSMRKINGVITANGAPAEIREQDMVAMFDVPGCLRAVREAQEEAKRIKAGDRAEVVDGEMAGWQIRVDGVDEGFASFIVPLLGFVKGKVEIGRLRKIEA